MSRRKAKRHEPWKHNARHHELKDAALGGREDAKCGHHRYIPGTTGTTGNSAMTGTAGTAATTGTSGVTGNKATQSTDGAMRFPTDRATMRKDRAARADRN